MTAQSTPASGASHADGTAVVTQHNPQTPLDTEAPGGTVDPTLRACQWAGLRNPGSAPGLATTGAPENHRLRLVVVDWQTARGFCQTWHRHHPKPPPGHLFRTGVAAGPLLVGVAIVGRPVSFVFDDGQTVEVNRTVTDSYKNANSMLYGAVARAAFALGYTRVITYTQEGESGASLRAAGYRIVAQRPARAGWDSPSRPRDDHGADHMPRTLWEAS